MMKGFVKDAVREVLTEIATELVIAATVWYTANKATIPADMQAVAAELFVLANQFLAPPVTEPTVTK